MQTARVMAWCAGTWLVRWGTFDEVARINLTMFHFRTLRSQDPHSAAWTERVPWIRTLSLRHARVELFLKAPAARTLFLSEKAE